MAAEMIQVTVEIECHMIGECRRGICRLQNIISVSCIPSAGDWIEFTTNMDGSLITPDPFWLTVDKREFTVANGRSELILLCEDHNTYGYDDDDMEWLVNQGWREVTEAKDGR
jgi:hypothetical protein